MSAPVEIPKAGGGAGGGADGDGAVFGTSPMSPRQYLIPSPIPTRRTRTYSASERAMTGPTYKGVIKTFCREKGHGFIKPNEGGDPLFVHISDFEGEFVPKPGDEVNYKTTLIPPKCEKKQAVHVRITHGVEGVKHERWETPIVRPSSGSSPSNT